MNACAECKQEVLDSRLLYDKKEDCYLCKSCFVSELLGRAEKNPAERYLMNLNVMGRAAAVKAAELLFDKMKAGNKGKE